MSETNGTPENGQQKVYTKKYRQKVVQIENDEGVLEPHILRQLDGSGAVEIQEFRENAIVDGKLKPGTPLVFIVKMICKCLIGPDGKYVNEADVLTYPYELQQDLLMDALRINGMDPQAAVQAKNA